MIRKSPFSLWAKFFSLILLLVNIFFSYSTQAAESSCSALFLKDRSPSKKLRRIPQYFNHAVPQFHKLNLDDIIPAFRILMEKESAALEKMVESKSLPNFRNTVEVFERYKAFGTLIQRYFQPYIHSYRTDEISEIYQQLIPLFVEHNLKIFQNRDLFQRFLRVKERRNELKLTEEQLRLLESYIDSFKDSGVHLAEDLREEMIQIQRETSEAQKKFGDNLLAFDRREFMVITSEEELKGISASDLNQMKKIAKEKKVEGYAVILDPTLISSIMRNAENRAFRQRIYELKDKKGKSGDDLDNTGIIKDLVRNRHRQAEILGFDTFADLILKDRMVSSFDLLTQLIDQSVGALKPKADEEFKMLTEYAKAELGIENLQPWDMSFVTNRYIKNKFKYDPEVLKEYFELDRSLQGLFTLSDTLYGLKFNPRPDLPFYAEGITAFEVFDKDDSLLGYILIDPYARTGLKKSGAWMSHLEGGHGPVGRRKPVYTIINMNLTPPTSDKEPVLMRLGEVKTLFHEFGHALHALMSDTRYYSHSGIKVAWDFVELPSMLNELFLDDPQVISWIGRHYKTGEPVPKDLLKSIRQIDNFMKSYNLLGQLEMSALDLAYHTNLYSEGMDIAEFEQKIVQKFQLPGQEIWPGSISHQFSHIFSGGYAAGYYSYFWAMVLRASAFSEFRKGGVLSREVGERFQKSILSVGDSVNATKAFRDFVGREPDLDDLLKEH